MSGNSREISEITEQKTGPGAAGPFATRVDTPGPDAGGALRLDTDGPVPPRRRAETGLRRERDTEEIPRVRTRAYEPPPLLTVAPRPEAIMVGTVGRAWRALVEAVGELLDGRQRLWALEAGAGTRTLFDLPEDAYILGVDRDLHALEVNARLDQRVPVDLVDYRPQSAGFDLISCWYVLDELADPAAVLDRFADWTAPGGLVVLGVPNLRSVRGVWARLRGRAKLRRPLTPYALRQRFDEHGFTPVFQVFYEDSDQIAVRRRLRISHGRWSALQAAVRMLSLGFLDAARTDYLVVFRRDE